MFKYHIFEMKRKPVLSIMLFQQEHDEPILKHLQDIKVIFSGPDQPMVRTVFEGFMLILKWTQWTDFFKPKVLS